MAESDFVTRVVTAVANADGVDTTDLDPLSEHIDPDVLTKLYNQETGVWDFTFQYSDHQVTVTHDARIIVDGTVQARESQMRHRDVDDNQ